MRIEKMSFNKYQPILKIGFFTMMTYRWECLFATLASLLTIGFMYFLWTAIFLGAEHPNVIGFQATFIYVAMSIAILVTFNTSTDAIFANSIVSGDIIRELIRPLNLHIKNLVNAIGVVGFRFCLVFLPSLIIVFSLSPANAFNSFNLLMFSLSLVGSFLIIFHLDMLIAMISVRTEASWGIRLAKDYLVSLLSGAIIPFHFLPDSIRQVFMFLPFQGICHTPLYLLTHTSAAPTELIKLLLLQIFWCVVLILLVHWLLKLMIEKIEIFGG